MDNNACNESARLNVPYSKIRRITSVDNMIVGNQLYSSLSMLKRQSLLMLTELPGMRTVFERLFQLECSVSYTCNMHGDARIEGYHYSICHWVQHLKHPWLRTTTHFFLMVLVSAALRVSDILSI